MPSTSLHIHGTSSRHPAVDAATRSHEEYKTWVYALSSAASRANLFRNLESLHGVRAQQSFTQALKQSFNEDRLLIFDHKNNLYHLPRKATANDFASQVKELGKAEIKGVRINGRWQPLYTQLRDGDTVEVVHTLK